MPVVAAVALRALPTPDGLAPAGHTVAAITLVTAVWWVRGVLPMAVTALVPLVALPLLGVRPLGEVTSSYADPLIFLMLGGFLIGHAMERVGLHRRMTAWLLAPGVARQSPRTVLAGLMIVSAVLSGLISNTATTLMMLPLAQSLARRCGEATTPCFVLGLAYAASLGGMATLVGTPTNAILAGFAPKHAGVEIGFGTWLLLGVPMVVALLPIAWFVLVRTFALPGALGAPLEAPPRPEVAPGEPAVWAIAGGALLAWVSAGDKDLGGVVIPGWARLVSGTGSERDALVALAAALLLFLVPVGQGRALLSWREAERAVPWSVLLLLGGGFALADGIEGSGLTVWLATGADAVLGLPLPVTVFVVCVVMVAVSELTSNMAAASIALPVLAEGAVRVGVAPLVWMVPATLAASCGFMLPIATAPNAIASEAGGVSGRDMARAGAALNLAGAVVITLGSLVLVPLLFG